MTLHAGWPGWMTLILIMALMGPMMRMMFGGHNFPPQRKKRLKGKASEELARVDEALAERDEVIEDLQRRLSEMESRLDFTERLLARSPGATVSNAEVAGSAAESR